MTKTIALCALIACGQSTDRPTVGTSVSALADGLDPAGNYLGPLAVTASSYKLTAAVQLDVLDYVKNGQQVETELWGAVWHPDDLSAGPYPLVLMMHGEAQTCVIAVGDFYQPDGNDYSLDGTCDNDFAEHHLGFEYLGHRLASYGHVVVSINANRGIVGVNGGPMGDQARILAGGRLVLKHLEQWHDWASNGGAPGSLAADPNAFVGAIDFGRVGLMGHSRGGERMRAAQAIYLENGSPWPAAIPGLVVQAIFEIASTDHPTTHMLTPENTAWHTLIATCDEDQSDGTPAHVFARQMADSAESPYQPKSIWWVHGANHNYFNRRWNGSEANASGCDADKSATAPLFSEETLEAGGDLGESPKQLYAALSAFIPFMRQHLTNDPFLYVFHKGFANPLKQLDPELEAQGIRVDREFVDSPSDQVVTVLDNFTTVDQSGLFQPFGSTNLVAEEVDQYFTIGLEQRLQVTWESGGQTPTLDLTFGPPGQTRDLSDHITLDFRVARSPDPLNVQDETNFSVQLIGLGWEISNAIQVQDVVTVIGPFERSVTHTARIRLDDFDIPKDAIRGVRFSFDQTPTGQLWLDDVLFSKYGVGVLTYYPLPTDLGVAPLPSNPGPDPVVYPGFARTLGTAVVYDGAGLPVTVYELEVSSDEEIRDDNRYEPVLQIGAQDVFDRRACTASRTPGCLVFQIEASRYQSLEPGDPMTVRYHGRANSDSFDLGVFTGR